MAIADMECDALPVLRIVQTSSARHRRLVASADLDLATEEQVRADLSTALSSGEGGQCIVDVSRVFVDLRGLAALLDGVRLARRYRYELAVVASASLRTMHRVLSLDAELTLVDLESLTVPPDMSSTTSAAGPGGDRRDHTLESVEGHGSEYVR